MLKELKKEVYEANILLPKYNLITFTWGNVSGIDREKGLVVIKPSGVEYDSMDYKDMVIVDLNTSEIIDGNLNPSSDTQTHLEIYRNFKEIGGIVHTHSLWATIFAQANKDIPPFGTTHSDYFYGSIPCTRKMTDSEIDMDYELETGKVIVETFKDINPMEIPGVLVANHGPFTWGKNPLEAVHNAVVLEEIAHMAWHNKVIDPNLKSINQKLLDKHFLRKHGKDAYYGQF